MATVSAHLKIWIRFKLSRISNFQLTITARSIIASFAERPFANLGNGFVQRLNLVENLLWDRGMLMLSQVIPKGLNTGLVQEAQIRNHVRAFGRCLLLGIAFPMSTKWWHHLCQTVLYIPVGTFCYHMWSAEQRPPKVIVLWYIDSAPYRPALLINSEINCRLHSSCATPGL